MKFKRMALIAAAAVALAGCGVSNQPDQSAVVYENAFWPTDQTFKSCVDPATQKYIWDDDAYVYPFGQRTWTFGTGQGQDTEAIEVVTKEQQKMFVSGTVTFALNTSCEPDGDRWPGGAIQQFHERIGLKYKAWEDEGWVNFLNTYLDEPLNKALDTASQTYSYKDLYGGAEDVAATKRKWEQTVVNELVADVNNQAGFDLFCNPSYDGNGECGTLRLTLQKPDISDELAKSLEKREQAIADNAAQAELNETQLTELEGVQDRIDVLGGVDNYLLEQAIKSGSIELLPLPEGADLIVGK